MTMTITGRNYEVKESTRSYIERKLRKLTKFSRKLMRVEVTVARENEMFETDIRMKADRGEFYAATEGHFLRTTLDRALSKLERQLDRHGGKLQDRRRRAGTHKNGRTPALVGEEVA